MLGLQIWERVKPTTMPRRWSYQQGKGMSQMEQGRQDPVIQLSRHQDLPLKQKRQRNLIADDRVRWMQLWQRRY
jgi:hypothetical protein